MMQTILGANGTIGTLLAAELRTYTQSIRLVSRNPKKVNDTDQLFPVDLLEPGSVEKAVAGSDVVYLVVGLDYNIKVWQEKWPVLMRSTIDACVRNKARLVFFDNVYMYDIKAIPHMTEDSPINPPSRKGIVRKQISQMLMDEVKAGRLEALIARAADFYGPGADKSLVTEMVVKNLLKGKSASWPVDADKKHTFTFVPDAAKATALLGNTSDAYNQVWHLPTDRNALTGREFISLIAESVKKKNKVSVMPVWLFKILGIFIPILKEMPEMMYQYDRDYIFDSSKFEKKFNFKPTTYRDGVRQTVA